jgi:hypothetical protein
MNIKNIFQLIILKILYHASITVTPQYLLYTQSNPIIPIDITNIQEGEMLVAFLFLLHQFHNNFFILDPIKRILM